MMRKEAALLAIVVAIGMPLACSDDHPPMGNPDGPAADAAAPPDASVDAAPQATTF